MSIEEGDRINKEDDKNVRESITDLGIQENSLIERFNKARKGVDTQDIEK